MTARPLPPGHTRPLLHPHTSPHDRAVVTLTDGAPTGTLIGPADMIGRVVRPDAVVPGTPSPTVAGGPAAELESALADALLAKLGERALNWEPSIDVARQLLADPRVAAVLGGAR